MSNSQFLVDALLVRTKRGPYNKISRIQRLDKVKELYFDKERSITEVANTLGIHRNTISSDVESLRDEFLKNGGENETIDFYYRKKSMFARQRLRLEEKMQTESDIGNHCKIEKLLLDLVEKEYKLFTKFIPSRISIPKTDKKLLKKIIRELAFDEFAFFGVSDLIREIICKAKCDAGTAFLIVSQMEALGLNYAKTLDSQTTCMIEFANMCGYLSEEETLRIKQERALRVEQEEQENQKRLAEFNKKFKEEFGDSKNWSAEVEKKYRDGYYALG